MSSEIPPELIIEDESNWLPSSGTWSTLLPPFFEGKRIFDGGNQAIVGLWSYNGPADLTPAVKDLVVKQSNIKQFNNDDDALLEGKLLARLSKAKSRHIVRMFGTTMRDIFQDDPVVRIFLEFCPGDTLARLLPKKGDALSMLTEMDLWGIFYCLSLGLLVMERGSEDPSCSREEDYAVKEITHYDLTPWNVFVGYRDKDHTRYPISKIADFGTAIEELNMASQNDDTGIGRPFGGNKTFRPPEADDEIKLGLREPRKGTTSNIFQVGCVMHTMMELKEQDFRIHNRTSKASLKSKKTRMFGESYGFRLKDPTSRYSKSLRDTVMRCMFREPLLRPNAVELLGEVKIGLDAAKLKFVEDGGGMLNIPMADVIWPEPPSFPTQTSAGQTKPPVANMTT